ncbi:hypothetical protein SGQ83_08115 [Flavobacterium sp. Fl-318]|uniref:Uncharacterized protein n=1 Tax=Flavobacterium cupriresistens TaxID=2893885 RepID=A0ABU4R9Q1_9FLAO|nr:MULTISPECIES: hypothetical protein [unclassified Flavobacterium]MDX6189306.1 hypothetical protein [Flavobacterium sp. Fl-318]UFH41402.1 hypothetical protein LNP23_16485 [Flavobacterium sp. F-323]
MENKYEINQKVVCLGKRCIVSATKKLPKKNINNPYLKEEIKPEKDYFLYIFAKYEDGNEVYSGTLDVFEDQIEFGNW